MGSGAGAGLVGTVECPHIGWRVIALARHGSSDSPSSETIPYFLRFQIILTILTIQQLEILFNISDQLKVIP